jgi:branched-chain amino acid transport system substrate-binding protein
MKDAKGAGLSVDFIGTDRWRTDGMLGAYKADVMSDMVFTTYYNEDARITEMSSVFLDAYRDKYGANATPDPAVALAFDAYLIALEGLREAGASTDHGKILAALHDTNAFSGASGEITFDDRGNPIKPITITTVTDGKFVLTDSVKPEKEKGN